MDKIYLIFVDLMIVSIIICTSFARKVKSDVSSSIVKCCFFAIITILSNYFFAFSQSETFSYIMGAAYLFSFDVVLIYTLEYTQQYTRVFNRIMAIKKGCFVAAYLDGIALFINIDSHKVFTIKSVSYMNLKMYQIVDKTLFYYFHYIYAYCLVFCIIAAFAVKIKRTPYFYHKKYMPILVIISIIVAINFVCDISEFPVDLSLPLIVFAAILICYLSLYRSPRELIDKTLSFVVGEMNTAVICFDVNEDCVYANDGAMKIFNEQSDLSVISDRVREWIKDKNVKDVDYLMWSDRKKTGDKEYYFDIEYRKLFGEKNEYIGFFISFVDNTKQQLAFEREKYIATHDRLTGLYNKDYFSKKAAEAMKADKDEKWLLLSSNIKDFKLINDLFGQKKGNLVLKMQADLLKARCGKGVIYGRIEGDKFAICIPKKRFHEQDYIQVIQSLRSAINNELYHLHIYIGVYEVTDVNEDISIMCDKANLAIKTLSENYERSIVYYSDAIFDNVIIERQFVGDFEEAVSGKQFCMYLQPQMTPHGKLLGAEALVRWQHPKRGLIFPGDFIEIFEKTGLIYRLDKYIWECAVQKLAEWQKEGRCDLYISVNISTKDFGYIDVYETITSLVENYRIIPSTLKLEITETALMTGGTGEFEIIDRFREYGFQVEIDDFGSGYSSLNTLKDIDVDVLKIDMGFLRTTRPERMERSMAILNTIISLAKTLGVSVITEGVETKEQVERLTKMGCEIYQGYYFSKPISVETFEDIYLA